MLKLISSVASTAPTDDKSREAVVWHPAAVAVTAHGAALNDPLGFGRIDLPNLRLVRGVGGSSVLRGLLRPGGVGGRHPQAVRVGVEGRGSGRGMGGKGKGEVREWAPVAGSMGWMDRVGLSIETEGTESPDHC